MATTIVTKSGSGAPTASDLVAGELAVDLTNKRLYTENSGGTVIEVGSNPYNFTANHDGSAKLATTATGIDVTGSVTASGEIIAASLDISGDIDVDGTTNLDVVDIDGAVDMASTLAVGGTLSSGDITIEVDDTPTLNFKKASSDDVLGTINVSTDAGSGGKMVFQTKRNGNTAVDRLTIDDDGKVGIGTGTPSALLGLNAAAPDFTLLQSDAVKFRMGVSGGVNGGVTGSALGDYFARTSGGKMLFSTNDGVTAHAVIDSNGNVGIGTSALISLGTLVVQQSADSKGIALVDSAAANTFFIENEGDEVKFRVNTTSPFTFAHNTTERMRIDGNGNLLVGLATGQAALIHAQAPKTTYTDYATVFAGGTDSHNGDHAISLMSAGNSLAGIIGSNLSIDGSTFSQPETARSSGYISFSNNTTAGNTSVIGFGGLVKGTTTPIAKMTLDGDGNLGIGGNPTAPLHVFGSGILGANAVNPIAFTGSGGNNAGIGSYTANTDFSLYSAGTGDIKFRTGAVWNSTGALTATGSEAMRINSSGKVGIGLDGAYKLDVLNTVGNVVSARFTTTATSSTEYGPTVVLTNDPNDTTRYFFAGTGATTERIKILSNGNIVNQNNSYTGISDEKLKENIVDAGSQWDDIKALRVRKYSLKEENASEPTQIGVIAQEVEEAGMSGLVCETADQDTAEDGSFVDTGEVTKTMKYSILYMKAVKALQEAMNRIETLEAKVAALES